MMMQHVLFAHSDSCSAKHMYDLQDIVCTRVRLAGDIEIKFHV
jgi:hypothetical protein